MDIDYIDFTDAWRFGTVGAIQTSTTGVPAWKAQLAVPRRKRKQAPQARRHGATPRWTNRHKANRIC
jgi:hypothetical protein